MGPLEHRPKIAHHNIGQRGPTMVAAATSGLWGSTRRDMSLGYNLPPSFRGSSSGFPTPKTWLRRPKRCIASHGAWSSWPSTWPPAMAIEGGQQCHPRSAPWLGTGGLISSLPRSTKQGRWGNTDEAVWYEVPPLDQGTQALHFSRSAIDGSPFFIAEAYRLRLTQQHY